MFRSLAIAAAGITVSSLTYAADLKIDKDDFIKETSRYVRSTSQESLRDKGIIRIQHVEGHGGEEAELLVITGTIKPVSCDQNYLYYKVDNQDAVQVDAKEHDLKFCSFTVPTSVLIGARTFAVRVPMFRSGPTVLTINISARPVQGYFKEVLKKPE